LISGVPIQKLVAVKVVMVKKMVNMDEKAVENMRGNTNNNIGGVKYREKSRTCSAINKNRGLRQIVNSCLVSKVIFHLKPK
jgi:hypothetical protein